jgi:integrase
VGGYDNEAEARECLDAALAELTSGWVLPKHVKSFATAGPKWLDERELAGSRDTATDRSRWDQYVAKAPFYELPLRRITPAACFEWRQALRFATVRYPYDHPRNGERISLDTVERIFSLASAFMQDATNSGWVPSNPFRLAGKPKRKKARTEEPWTYLDPREQQALLDAVPEGERDIVEVLLCTGWRPSEAAWLPLADVHLDAVDVHGAKTPYVDVRLSRGGKARKNGVPFRHYLIPRAAEALERWLKRLRKYAPKNPRALVFPLPDGRRRSSGWFFGSYKKDG